MTYVSTATANREQISAAARWLADHWSVAPQPITRTLREQFGLNFVDSARAIAQARRQHTETGNGQ